MNKIDSFITGGKKWEAEEKSKKESLPMCGCGRDVATTYITTDSFSFDRYEQLECCEACKAKAEE